MLRNKTGVWLLAFISVGSVIYGGFASHAAAHSYFDSYSAKKPWNEERLHLDNFAIYLNRDPKMIGYIGLLSGKDASRKHLGSRARKAVTYLTRTRGVDKHRVKVLYAGTAEEAEIILQPVERGEKPPF